MFGKWKTELFDETDQKFVVGASLTLALLFVLLYFNYQDSDDGGQRKQVGTLLVKRNIVQRKAEARVVWRTVQQSYPVYEGDTVRTGEDSAAVLHLDGKFKMDMDENTVVLLDFLDSSQKGRVRLGNGSVRFRQADPKDPKILNLEVVDKGKKFSLSGVGELLLNRNKPNERLEVAALNDKVKLTGADGLDETLTPDSLLVLSGEKVSRERLTVIPQKPKDGAYIAGPGRSIAVAFSWKFGGSKKEKVQIEISESSDLSSPILRKKTARPSFTTRLKPGTYYWRLLAPPSKNLPGKYSITRKFSVLSQGAVETYKPSARRVFVYRDIEPFVSFSWSRDPNATAYFLEVAKDSKFRKSVIQKNTSSLNYGSDFSEGQYYWRVTVKNSLTGSSIASRSKSFKIIRKKELALNVKVNLAPNQILDKKSIERRGFVFNWSESPEVARTEIIVSEDPEFSKTVVKEKVSKNFYRMKAKLSKSVYYYKIKSYNEQGELLSDPPVRSFRVQNTKIKIKNFAPSSPKNNASLHKKTVLGKGVRFAWSKPVGIDAKFEFFLASDRSFKRTLSKKETKESSLKSKDIKGNGKYFWKVKAFDAEDNSMIAETKVFSFTVVQLPVITVSGVGRMRGRVVSSVGDTVKISTPKGIITTTIDKIEDIQHDY